MGRVEGPSRGELANALQMVATYPINTDRLDQLRAACGSVTYTRMRRMMTRDLGPLVAHGNTSEVFAWGKNAVVKVLLSGIPEDWADREAETTDLVHAAGLPAPEVRDVVTVGGRPGIVFERIEGDSMWDQMVRSPGEIPSLSLVLAEMQAEINETTAPKGLPTLFWRLHDNIERAESLSATERSLALIELEDLPDGEALCHFDVHPNNVLMGSAKPVVIDWFDAAVGAPEADIVRSSVLMRRDATETHLSGASPSLISRLHDEYLACLARTREVDYDHLLTWERSVLASRLAEPMPDSVLADVHSLWRNLHTRSGSSELVSSLERIGLYANLRSIGDETAEMADEGGRSRQDRAVSR